MHNKIVFISKWKWGADVTQALEVKRISIMADVFGTDTNNRTGVRDRGAKETKWTYPLKPFASFHNRPTHLLVPKPHGQSVFSNRSLFILV